VLLQCVAVCCSVGTVALDWFKVDLKSYCSVLQCVAVYCCVGIVALDWFEVDLKRCCSVLQCLAVCCSVLRRCDMTHSYV